ncbi:flavonoid 3'-monooxygenase-like [Hibiscus syriacus]|uniref:Flavonoid 3'-monooxygenase-like n=1 Tax=Hibiscus syriacus TaxID=106335 RepID=A0A6A3BCW2_HIBSY|nr:flavonoid 3'-monooxygenase-like [Hibiscus syriacus]
MNSILAVDRLSLVKYVFPVERLPEWVQFMLSNGKYCRVISDLCPFLKGKVEEVSVQGSLCQIQLNVFEYYLFWFAYYPVCKGNSENLDSNSVKRSSKFRLENWTRSIPGFSGSIKCEMDKKLEGDLYIQLLYAYLRVFVPIFDLGAHQPYRSSILNHSLKCDGSVIFRAEFFVNIFVQYWLVDNDFSPLPVTVCKSFGVWFPFKSVLGEIPPTSGLGEVVKLFVKYLNLSSLMSMDGFDSIEYNESSSWRVSAGFDRGTSRNFVSLSPSVCPVGPWNSCIQRPLYSFILRTFLFSPMGTSIKNTFQVFSVWVSYVEPWTISLDDFAELDAVVNGSIKDVSNCEQESQISGYSPAWEAFVSSNFPYYSSLVMHFIGFAHKFFHTDPQIIAQMVLKDWEDGLCESDADGSFLHDNWNKDLTLFSDGEDGGQRLLQATLQTIQAQVEIEPAVYHYNINPNPIRILP